MGSERRERFLDQPDADAPVPVVVHHDQVREAVLRPQRVGDVDRFLEASAPARVDRVPDCRQVRNRQKHRGVADHDRRFALRVRVHLGVAAMDVLAAEARLSRPGGRGGRKQAGRGRAEQQNRSESDRP
jgi:hypothetical protein